MRRFASRVDMRLAPTTVVTLLVLFVLQGTSAAPKQLTFVNTRGVQRTSLSVLQSGSCKFLGNQFRVVAIPIQQKQQQSKRTSLRMFMGSDGGILGVGAPEIATILLVGYFVLGPSDLYKVVKEVGKFIQNFRTLGTDLTKTVESNLESNLELEEIRKAQRELNDAFSFRRTINTDGKTDAFATTPEDRPGGELSAEPVVASTVAAGTKKRKKVRRRKVKKEVFEEGEETPVFEAATIVAEDISIQGNVPDLDMSAAFYNKPASASTADLTGTAIESGEERLSKDREERLESETPPVETSEWWNAGLEEDATEPVAAEAGLMSVESDRFTAQLSGDWNESVLTNEGKLSPLAKIIDRLTILEEEKSAADERLEEEFRLRGELEEKYYREKRDLLETAAAEIQVDAYGGMVEDRNS